MKREKWALRLSITAIILCIITFLLFHTRLENFLPSTNDFLVTVLAILVTVLIAWQIFNIINFENRLAKLKDEAVREIKKEVEKEREKIEKLEADFNERAENIERESRKYNFKMFYNLSHSFFSSKNYINSLQILVLAIENMNIQDDVEMKGIIYNLSIYEKCHFKDSDEYVIKNVIEHIDKLPGDKKLKELISIRDVLISISENSREENN